MKNLAWLVAVVVACFAPLADAGEEGSGRFAIHNVSSHSTDLPDGGRIDVVHYYQITFADQEGHPLDNTSADCVGRYLFTKDGAVASASGSCFGKNASGGGASFWWRLEKQGTPECPGMCGSWGYYDGFGTFEGISGGGVWHQTTMFADGSTGIWKGTHSME